MFLSHSNLMMQCAHVHVRIHMYVFFFSFYCEVWCSSTLYVHVRRYMYIHVSDGSCTQTGAHGQNVINHLYRCGDENPVFKCPF